MNELEFEWDEAKAELNARKHGVSFAEAQAIWSDPMFLEVRLASGPEERFAAIGRVGKSAYLTAIVTYRGEAVRIISARKSTKKEADLYGKH